jgi:hypothetical protein
MGNLKPQSVLGGHNRDVGSWLNSLKSGTGILLQQHPRGPMTGHYTL